MRTELEGVVVENSPCEMGKPFKTLSLHSGLGNRRNLDISNVVISCGDLSQQSWFLVISKKNNNTVSAINTSVWLHFKTYRGGKCNI